MIKALKKELPLIMIMLLTLGALFVNLGDRRIAEDEYATVLYAHNIETCGYPNRYPCTEETKFTRGEVDNLFPSFIFYNAFIGMRLFDNVALGSRFFPTLFAWLSIPFVFFIAHMITKNRFTSYLSVLFYVTSLHFHLHARFARYYGLALFLIAATTFWFLRMCKDHKKTDYMLFALGGVLLAYTQFQVAFYILASLCIYYVLFVFEWKYLKRFSIAVVAILFFVFPQLIYRINDAARGGMLKVNYMPLDFVLQQSLAFFYLLTMIIPLILIPFYFMKKSPLYAKKQKGGLLSQWTHKLDRGYLFVIYHIVFITLTIGFINHNGFPEARKLIVAIILCASLFLGILTARFMKQNATYGAILALLLITSNVLFMLPFAPLKLLNLESNSLLSGIDAQQREFFFDKGLQFHSYQYDFIFEHTKGYKNVAEIILPQMNVQEDEEFYGITLTTDQMFEDLGVTYTPHYRSPPTKVYDYYLIDSPELLDDISIACATMTPYQVDYSLWEGATNILHRHFYNKYETTIYVGSNCQEK